MGKINRYIINNCFAFVDFVHISIAFMKSWYCFFVFASRFVLLFFCLCLLFFRSGTAILLIYGLIMFVLFAQNLYVNIYVFVQNMNCKLKIKNRKTIKKLKIENRKCKSGSEKQKLILENWNKSWSVKSKLERLNLKIKIGIIKNLVISKMI